MDDFESLKTFILTKEEIEERTEIILGNQGRIWFDRTGYHMTEEEKKHLSEVTKGVPKSLEHRKAISKGATGNTNWLGKNHSEESKQKMRKPKSLDHRKAISKAKKGKSIRKASIETKIKMAEAQKQAWIKRRQKCQS